MQYERWHEQVQLIRSIPFAVNDLIPPAEKIVARPKARCDSIAIAESSGKAATDDVAGRMASSGRDADPAIIHGQHLHAAGQFARLGGRK
jgi:hypothetical protein